MKNTWEKTIQETMSSVVTVVISKSLEEIEKQIPHEMLPFFPYGAPKMQIPPEAIDAHGMVKIGSGSGFVVDSKGIILTNKHVVADKNAEYTIITNDNKKFKADVLARDPIDDVAILKISGRGLIPIKLGDSDKLALGQPVLAIGNALGLFKNTVSSGIISGLSRSISASASPMDPAKEMRGLIQTDAAINPGNSGGPLVDEKGGVIGINAAVVFGAQNLSFAIPVNAAKRDLADLTRFGRIKRPYLGLHYITVDDVLKEKLRLAVDYGALVISQSIHEPAVIPDSPADKAGVKERDIVTECNGEKITREKTIQDHLKDLGVGDYVMLKVHRGTQELETKAMLAERK
ncbi:MAG: trypsin-like peptidase domain-containing protein [Patescibacteria group bacterium]